MASRIVVVTGASGAGKTTIVSRLAERNLAGVTCAFFDSVGVPPPDEMPPDWQEKTTNEWIQRLARVPAGVAVLDGQTRPTFASRAFAEVGIRGTVVVIHCAREVRKARLIARGHPELATDDMHAWAAYLCGQADALGFPVIDTSWLDIEQSTDALVPYVIQGWGLRNDVAISARRVTGAAAARLLLSLRRQRLRSLRGDDPRTHRCALLRLTTLKSPVCME